MWNTEVFASLRPTMLERRIVIDHHVDGRHIGSFVGVTEDDEITSGYSAPYGGLDFVRSHETVDHVMGLVDRVVGEARERGIRRIEVRNKPPHYSETEANATFALFEAGFAVTESNLNFYLDLRMVHSVDEWRASLRKETRRALRALADLPDLTTRPLAHDDEQAWAIGYEVLRANRIDKGRPMHLGLDYVRALRDAFGPIVRMLVVEHDGRIVGAALIYRVGRGRDVVQYWGDSGHDLPRSPMPFLVEAVVADALARGAQFVDIGISTDHGDPNLGLIQFKRSVGCLSEVRLVLALDLVEA